MIYRAEKATEAPKFGSSGAALLLIENGKIRVCSLDKRPEWAIGRYDPGCPNPPQILFQSRLVSRLHGWLRSLDGQWYYVEEPKNLNGTFYNGVKLRKSAVGVKHPVPLAPWDILRIESSGLDRLSGQGVQMIFTRLDTRGTWTLLRLKAEAPTLIGRASDCAIVDARPYISAHHAKIHERDGGFWLSDCGSRAGTFLNGKRIYGPVLLQEKDCISICGQSYFYLNQQLLYKRESQRQRELPPKKRPVILKANIKTRLVKNANGIGAQEQLRNIRVEIREGTLVALLGSAGTALMRCLSGTDCEGVQGTVQYRGMELTKDFEQMNCLIGYVPRKKLFHSSCTLEQEFRAAARKLLPRDTTPQEIEERVDKVLEALGLTELRGCVNRSLSASGQARLNVGIELTAGKDLLCLDAPDSGLEPDSRRELFEALRSMAHESGKTVLVALRDASDSDMFDQVIMLATAGGTGRLAFSGSPKEARKRFGMELPEAAARLEQSPECYVSRRL